MNMSFRIRSLCVFMALSLAAMLLSAVSLAEEDAIPAGFDKIDAPAPLAPANEDEENQQTSLPEVDAEAGAISNAARQPADQPEPASATPTALVPRAEGTNKSGVTDALPVAQDFEILKTRIPPAAIKRLKWSPAGLDEPTPVWVINGQYPGKTLCLTAAIHGDELNGVEIVRRVMHDIRPKKLHGRIVGVPIVNLKGFQRGSRYLPDRRDLNRSFPGVRKGSLSSRIAYSLYHEIIQHCGALIDLHTGSLKRDNLLQVRADMRNPDVVNFTHGFDKTVVVHSRGHAGMLRKVAVKNGIPAVTLEAGESSRLQAAQIDLAVQSIYSLLQREGMYARIFSWGEPEPIYFQSHWLRADMGGILLSKVELGADVKAGQMLGTVSDPTRNKVVKIVAKADGRVIGKAVDQVVLPGFAVYHLGLETLPENCVTLDREIKTTELTGAALGGEASDQKTAAAGVKTVPTFSCPD